MDPSAVCGSTRDPARALGLRLVRTRRLRGSTMRSALPPRRNVHLWPSAVKSPHDRSAGHRRSRGPSGLRRPAWRRASATGRPPASRPNPRRRAWGGAASRHRDRGAAVRSACPGWRCIDLAFISPMPGRASKPGLEVGTIDGVRPRRGRRRRRSAPRWRDRAPARDAPCCQGSGGGPVWCGRPPRGPSGSMAAIDRASRLTDPPPQLQRPAEGLLDADLLVENEADEEGQGLRREKRVGAGSPRERQLLGRCRAHRDRVLSTIAAGTPARCAIVVAHPPDTRVVEHRITSAPADASQQTIGRSPMDVCERHHRYRPASAPIPRAAGPKGPHALPFTQRAG